MDFNFKIPHSIDGSRSRYCIMMDDMSPDYGTTMKSQWKTDIMEVRNDDLQRTYRVTGEVTKCGPYEFNYMQGGNKWLKPDGSGPDGARLGMYCGWITFVVGVG